MIENIFSQIEKIKDILVSEKSRRNKWAISQGKHAIKSQFPSWRINLFKVNFLSVNHIPD